MSRYRLTTEKTWSQTLDDLAETFRKWGFSTWSVEPTNPGRRAQNRFQTEAERTVILRYRRKGRDVMLTMARQDRAADNLRVLYLAVEAMRLNEIRGLAQIVGEAYRQTYPALPAPGTATTAPPESTTDGAAYATLHVLPSAPLEVCEAAYRALAKRAHADAGGGNEAMVQLNAAIERIREERR